MTQNPESGNVPRKLTIDSAGNVIPRPYGASRWANQRVRECAHECNNPATVLLYKDVVKAHNCCGEHEEGVMDEEEYDPDYDRVCSYPCHICGEEDEFEEDE